MPAPRPLPDAREVDRIEALATVDDPGRVDAFLAYCVPGSLWMVKVRTAEVSAHLSARRPLGTFSERDCLCLTLRLDRPVPVEPGLRIHLTAWDAANVEASGVVRPWGS